MAEYEPPCTAIGSPITPGDEGPDLAPGVGGYSADVFPSLTTCINDQDFDCANEQVAEIASFISNAAEFLSQ